LEIVEHHQQDTAQQNAFDDSKQESTQLVEKAQIHGFHPLRDKLPDEVDQNHQYDERQHKSNGVEVFGVDFHKILHVGCSEIGKMHGPVNTGTESQQGDNLNDETLAQAFPSEDKEDDGYDDI
jgi:hypothetical protein